MIPMTPRRQRQYGEPVQPFRPDRADEWGIDDSPVYPYRRWTISMFILAILFLAPTVHAQDHSALVRETWTELRTAGYNLSDGGDSMPCNNFLLVRAVVTKLKAEGAGALQKTTGTRCEFEGESYAKDIVAYPDGRIFDIIGVGPVTGSFDPHWDAKDPVEPSRWRALPPFMVGGPTPAPTPDLPPQGQPAPTIDLSAVIAEIRAVYAQNERIWANEQQQLAELRQGLVALDKALAQHDNEPSWARKVLGNRYVQMGLAAVAGKLGIDQLLK